MKNYVTSALHTLEARRATRNEWSRLELVSDLQRYANEDASEMRHFLAAQTSQTV